MTEEELDLLASSYLDGEATPQEMAMVERDPELRRRVEELRAVKQTMQTHTPVPDAIKEQHLAAALSAFSGTDRRSTVTEIGAPPAGLTDRPTGNGDSPVIQLDRPDDDTTADDGSIIDLRTKRQERDANRMRWLSAAAAVAVFSFGAVFLASQMNSADDTFEAATDAVDETGESAEADTAADDSAVARSEPAAAAEAADGATNAAQVAELESEELADDAEEDLATGDFATDEVAEEESVEEGADADAADSPIIVEGLPDSGFFPDEPVVTYSEIPTSDDMVNDLSLRWRLPDAANCAGLAELPADAELIAYLPIEVPDDDGLRLVEALYLTVGRESQVQLVDAATCAAL